MCGCIRWWISAVKTYFYNLFEQLAKFVQSNECLLANFRAEDSDFVRFNQTKVRQAGSVHQLELSLDLIRNNRHATAETPISGNLKTDTEQLKIVLNDLRGQYALLSEDPYLLINRSISNSETIDENTLQETSEIIQQVATSAHDLDLVGLYSSGTIYRGFANSIGQRNWYERSSFNLDWSCFLHNNRAAKSGYAEVKWNPVVLEEKLDHLREELAILSRPAKTITPGHYRVYLAPTALHEILTILAWRSFGEKSYKTRQSPLLKLAEQQLALNSKVTLVENNADGLAPNFTQAGFIKPAKIDLIAHGLHAGSLVDSRSAKEYGLAVNANNEYPQSLDLDTGTLNKDELLNRLDNGLYVNNLWYSNYSDPNHCRITGMTRYACFWVEKGKLTAPITPMRFDESVYDMLGKNLLELTQETQWLLDTDTYERRSVASMRLPGLLVDDFNFTL